jgi:hypothetical protein
MSQSIFSVFAAKTGRLESSKGNLTVDSYSTIDLHSSSIKLFRNPHCTVDILGEDRRRETEFGIVCAGNGFFLSLESIDNNDRTKDFFLVDRSIGFCVGKDGRLEI